MINLIHGDCLEELKKIPDKSIDIDNGCKLCYSKGNKGD